MKWFRHKLRENRIFILALLSVSVFYMVDGRNFVYAHQVHQQKEKRLQEISELLDVPVEKLRPDHETLFDQVKRFFVEEKDPVKEAGLKRLQEVLRQLEDQVASNPYLPQIERVKREHAVYRIEGVVRDLMKLAEPDSGKVLPEASQRAILRSLHHVLQDDLAIPLPQGLPPKAQAKHAQLQAKLDRLFDSVRPIVTESHNDEMKGTPAQKIGDLGLTPLAVKRASRGSRDGEQPLPWKRVEREARRLEVSLKELRAVRPVAVSAPPSRRGSAEVKNTVPAELVALAESLEFSPATILTYVHDRIDLDPKWGVTKPPVGTLKEGAGTAWDQAWLLRELLTAAGVDAWLEWGEIQVPIESLTGLTGIEDPFEAGSLMTTGGTPIVLLTQGSQVVAARLEHVWVKAYLDYIPHRGSAPGPGDTWVRMDAALKRFDLAEGIRIYDQVPFDFDLYIESGPGLSPLRYYQDALWSHIRANNVDCVTLDQLKRKRQLRTAAYPFVPGTLKGPVLRLNGESETVPEPFMPRISLQVRDAGGELLSWEAAWPAVYGSRLEIAWPGSTAADQEVLDQHGGVFETPPYLVDLRPAINVAGTEVVTGNPIGSAEEVEIMVQVTTPAGSQETFVHDSFAGEPSALVLDFGLTPQERLDELREVQRLASTSGDAAAHEAADLELLGATYLHNLGRDQQELAEWRWHRVIRLISEGLVTQTGKVTTTVAGTPLSFERAERYVDFPGFIVGLFQVHGEPSEVSSTMSLIGAQGSYLEGAVFSQVLQREGIAAVSALALAHQEGQQLYRVDSSNLEQALAAVDQGDEIESAVRSSVNAGRLAWIHERPLSIEAWTGSGYVLQDPATGAGAYLLSRGFSGGADVRPRDVLAELLGQENWLTNGVFKPFVDILLAILNAVPDPDQPEGVTGDPVNLVTGNFLLEEFDLVLGTKAVPVRWIRFYNSRSNYTSLMGAGWTHSFGENLSEQSDGSVLYREYDGTEHLFQPLPEGGYVSPPGKPEVLTRDASGFRLSYQDGSGMSFLPDGRLAAKSDRFGNSVTVNYDVDGQLESLTDAVGRTVLSFTLQDGKIVKVTDVAGREVVYTYSNDDLETVTDARGKLWSYSYDEDHNLVARRNPLGDEDTYSYDARDRCIRHVDRAGRVEHFAYSDSGRSAVVTDRRGFDSYVEFDEQGRALRSVDPLGNATVAGWDDDNNRTRYVDSRGSEWVRIYDDRGNVIESVDPLSRRSTLTYTEDGQVETFVDTDGSEKTFTYSDTGDGFRAASSMTVNGEVLTDEQVFNGSGELVSMTDSYGNMFEMTYDATTGAMTERTMPGGMVQTMTLDPLGLGLVETITGPGTVELNFQRDYGSGMITRIEDDQGYVVTAQYDDLGRQVRLDSPRGTTLMEYDKVDQMVAKKDTLDGWTRFEYDLEDNQIATVDALGRRTSQTYDPLGRPLSLTEPSGVVWTFGHCGAMTSSYGRTPSCSGGGCNGQSAAKGPLDEVCELTDPLGNTLRREYDALGRVVRVEGPLPGEVTEIEYNSHGAISSVTDPLERVTRFEYNSFGVLAARIEPNLARTEYQYQGPEVSRILDAENHLWTRERTFFPGGSLMTETDPESNQREIYSDTTGRIQRIVNGRGQEILYNYVSGRLASIEHDGQLESFGYDTHGRRNYFSNQDVTLSYELDELDRVTRVNNETLGESLIYEYDAVGNRVAMTGPGGRVEYFYDSNNRLVQIDDPVAGTFRFEYDVLGRRTLMVYPSGIRTSYSYDAGGRLTRLVSHNASGDVVDGFSYTYDLVGNHISTVSLRDGMTETFEYDELDRLKRWERGELFIEYDYDLVGNRSSKIEPGVTTTYFHDDANRMVRKTRDASGSVVETVYGWDKDGNQVEEVEAGSVTVSRIFDARNRLRQVDGVAGTFSYGYDEQGIRVKEVSPSGENLFLVGDSDVLAVFQGGLMEEYYTHGPLVDEPLARADDSGINYLHADGMGSITAWSDPSGQRLAAARYRPFGDVEGDTPQRFGFAGRELGATDYYFRARYYNPDSGRFLSRDPLASQARAPRDMNGFDYAYSNPLRFKDPSGEAPNPGDDFINVIGAFIVTIFALGVGYAVADACGTIGAWDCVLGALGAIPVAAVASKLVFWLGIVATFLGMATLFVKWLWVDEISWDLALGGLFMLGVITGVGIYFAMLVASSNKIGKAGSFWLILGISLATLYFSWNVVAGVEGRKRPLFD